MQTATLSSGFVAEAADRQEKRRRATQRRRLLGAAMGPETKDVDFH